MCRRCYVSSIALDVIMALFTVFSCVCGNVIAEKINTGYLYIRISLAATKFAPLTYIMLLLHLAANNAALSAATRRAATPSMFIIALLLIIYCIL